MGNSRLFCRAQQGVSAPLVEVETHLGPGLPGFNVVGLPETAVREARDRVRSAITNSGFQFPQQRITVNLAPADLPKTGGRFDLAMALGILIASKQIPEPASDLIFVAELALSGLLRPVSGILPAALACVKANHSLVVAQGNGDEAARCKSIEVYCAETLSQVCEHLRHDQKMTLCVADSNIATTSQQACLSEIRGQAQAKRALEIAASGGHSLLLNGQPGSGKSMLATRLPGLLPALSEAQAMEVAAIYSLQQPRADSLFWRPPFRSPHHSASSAAMVGGGTIPKPGEISLAHHGVLFLDELPEFDRRVLEVLREPLETGHVHISRAAQQTAFPARFQLIAAMNPCPCGYLGDPARSCGYTCEKAKRYQGRLSGPLLDRIDICLHINPVASEDLFSLPPGESSIEVSKRVLAAQQIQFKRQGHLNNLLQRDALEDCLKEHSTWLQKAMDKFGLSARGLLRLVRVARTISDLAADKDITQQALAEAMGFRRH